MNIKRQYSLPNCTLVLEGLSDDNTTVDPVDGRPVLSTLLNAECHFAGAERNLQGGPAFFENFVKVVSAYAQESLSGVHHPRLVSEQGDQIHLEKGEGNLHHLIWKPAPESNEEPAELDLTTVQLFDLIEAVDQFFADSRTLPDLELKLQPVPRRYRQPDEPLIARLIPLTLGVSGLALATLISFMLPIPKVEKPVPKPRVSPSPTETIPNSNTTPVPPGATPSP